MDDDDRPGDQPAVTKADTRLDPDYEQGLADEAETGFDPPTLPRRHFGCPPLSGRASHSERVDLRVDGRGPAGSGGDRRHRQPSGLMEALELGEAPPTIVPKSRFSG